MEIASHPVNGLGFGDDGFGFLFCFDFARIRQVSEHILVLL